MERFSSLANGKSLSKKEISDECQKAHYPNNLLDTDKDILPQPTLSAITNPESDNIRLPNVNHLIALSIFFDVSIDYLVGLSNTKDVDFNSIMMSCGITENSINLLRLYRRWYELSKYSLFPASGYIKDKNGGIDVGHLPEPDKDGFYERYYIGNEEKPKETVIDEVKSLFEQYQAIIANIPAAYRIEMTENKLTSHIPKSHFFTTIEILLSYKNGMLLNLLSEYLFDANDHENSDAILLSQISACIIRIHDSIKDNATTLKE